MSRLNRRSFVAQVAGVAVTAGGLATAAAAQVTDRDGGATADPAARGRGPARTLPTGVTDSDAGGTADRASYGRNASRAPSMSQPNAVQGSGCRTFSFNGANSLVQSDGYSVQLTASSQAPNPNGNINFSGTAQFWRGRISVSGTVNGFVRGNTISFRIHWQHLFPDGAHFDEMGIYEGAINADGQATGTVYSHGRPRPRSAVTWIMQAPLTCVR